MARQRGDEHPAGDDGQDADGDIDEEDRLPGEAEELRVDEQAPEDRPADRGEAGREAEQREGLAALMRGEGHGGDGQHLRGHHRAGKALDDAGDDQHLDRVGHAAQRRGGGEGGDAPEEHAGAPHDVAQPPERQQPEGKGQHIGGHDPLDLVVGGVERLAHGGERHIDDGHVDEVHEIGDQQDHQSDPAAWIWRARSACSGRHRSALRSVCGCESPLDFGKDLGHFAPVRSMGPPHRHDAEKQL